MKTTVARTCWPSAVYYCSTCSHINVNLKVEPGVTVTSKMTKIVVKIMIKMMSGFAIATKEVTGNGPLSKSILTTVVNRFLT